MVLGSVKVLDLQLQGNQVNLLQKPTPRDQLTERRKVARSLRPCTLQRPMSATPYQEMKKEKKTPSWSRPQSAGSSSKHGQNKLIGKLSHSSLNDPESCLDYGTSYASSQFLHSLMGSCSPIEGVNSPSPQPSFDNEIAVGAHLEPGLTGKPPLPPTPQPPATDISDDSISLKFQRWFPDAILDSEILSKQSLTVDLYQKKDETDHSDVASVADCAELSDKEFPDKNQSPSKVKFSKVPAKNNLEGCNQDASSSFKGCALSPPEIVVHKPNHYGCHVVTEEFTSATNRCLTPDYRKNSKSEIKRNNKKVLSLSDLKDVKTTLHYDEVSQSPDVHSDSDIFNSKTSNTTKINNQKFEHRFCDSELYKKCSKQSSSHNDTKEEFGVTPKIDALSSTFTLESNQTVDKITSSCNDGKIQEETFKANPSSVIEELFNQDFLSNRSDLSNATIDQSPKNSNHSPPLIKLSCEGGKLYHNHLTIDYLNVKNESCSFSMKEKEDLDVTSDEKVNRDVKGNNQQIEDESIDNVQQLNKQRHAHVCPVDKLDVKKTPHLNEVPQQINSHSASDTYKNKSSTMKKETPDTFENRYSNYYELSENNQNLTKTKTGMNQNNQIKINENTAQIITRRRSVESITNKTPRDKNHTAKDLNRAASVPPSFLKSNHSKTTQSRRSPSSQKYKKLNHNLSFDDSKSINDKIFAKDSGVSSYEDIVSMISVLEQEEMKSCNVKYSTNSFENDEAPEPSSSVKAILNFLDDVEKDSMAVVSTRRSPIPSEDGTAERKDPVLSSRMGSLLSTDMPELAKQVMTLSLQLEESRGMCTALEERHKQTLVLLERQKVESNETNARHQSFINQLLKEKQQLAVQYETALQDVKGKHETATRVLVESHKIELKKNQDKFNAAEKIRRDKWIDAKTKKIKELTVRGLEPELERMAVAHQEEIAELRRVHQRQLTETEAAWARRGAAMREQEAAERQAAVQRERDAARQRVEQEIMEIEKSYQEQRRRLLEEVRQEKEMVQRQSERIITEKQAVFDKKVMELQQNLQYKMAAYEKQQQDEMAKIKEGLESDTKALKAQQIASLEKKEAAIREEMKMERDRHIELVISRLEMEAATKEHAIDSKFKKLKETYASEVNDLENELKDARCRLKEVRSDLQRSDDSNGSLAAQLSQTQAEMTPLRQALEKLRKEHEESIQQYEKKLSDLQLDLNSCKQSLQVQVNKINHEKEKELQQVYSRVREAINKKEEALQVVSRQRDAVLEQCSRLEKLLQNQRAQLH